RILNYFPRYKVEGSIYEDFYRVKLTLNYPYRRYTNLITIKNIVYESYSATYYLY
ncbi:hypothetical protein QBC39DRAFT_251771, partial [Podospora conica]